jgi:hypothetical protein
MTAPLRPRPRPRPVPELLWSKPINFSARDAVRRCEARGPQGSVQFFLQRINGGVYVEREEIPRGGIRTCQSVHFSDHSAFEHWCHDDPTRFEHPLLHARLERDGAELWLISR